MNRPGFWLGILLIIVGILLLMDNMYVIDFWDIVHTYWPVIFIFWGLSKLMRRSSHGAFNGRVTDAKATMFQTSDADRLFTSTTFGDYTVAVQSKCFAGGSVSTTFGNADIDLTGAELAEGEQSLRVDGVFGNAWIHLPKGMAYAVYANTTFGSIRINEHKRSGISSSLDIVSPDFQTAKNRLRISIARVFGDVTVIS